MDEQDLADPVDEHDLADHVDEHDLADPVDELVATQPIEEAIDEHDPVDEPIAAQSIPTQRRARVITTPANTIPLGGSTRRRTSGMAQTSTRVIRRTN